MNLHGQNTLARLVIINRCLCVYTNDMVLTYSLTAFRTSELLRIKRWLWVLLISVLLHFVAIHWAGIQIVTPDLRNFNVIHASLHHAAAQDPVDTLPNNTAAVSPMIAAVLPSNGSRATKATVSMPVTLPIKDERTATNILTKTVKPDPAFSTSSPSRDTARYRINLPPSAQLRYETSIQKKGVPLQGQSTLGWQSEGGAYKINGATDIAGVEIHSFQSEGTIDQSGIVPLLYTEKSNRKSATNTHFQRERKLISFSSSTLSYPRQGDEQDRASIIWQLAGIGRGSPDKLMTDADLDIFVAGVRDGETWRIHVIGEEEIELPTGQINAWHMVRMPPVGTYQQRLDIWLAPRQAWYPVKLRYTQVNGDTLEMSLTRISSVPAH
jgi:hypothetical protein